MPTGFYDLGPLTGPEFDEVLATFRHAAKSRDSLVRRRATAYLERWQPLREEDPTRPARTAAQFAQLVPAREAFYLLTLAWNVSAAIAYVTETGKTPDTFDPIAYLERNESISPVVPDHVVDDTIDLTRPLIGVTLPRGHGYFVMDGWHRMHRARMLGIRTLPIHWLDEDESEALRLHS